MRSRTGPVPLNLVCHPQTPSQAIRGIDVAVSGAGTGGLNLAFVLEGDLSGFRVPEPRVPRRAGDLWRHSCFEAFVMAGTGPGYREFNFSPSGEWTVYDFHDYREGGALDVAPGPGVVVDRTGDRLGLEAEIRRDLFPPGHSFRLGLSAVLENADGELSYWALRHPPGKPDFHHADAFAFQLVLS